MEPIAMRVPTCMRRPGLVMVKAIHTAAFFSIAGSILIFTWDGLRPERRRRTGIAALIALTETAIYVSNNQVCPLATLAEELGARRGSVTDIFLPGWLSRRIPVLGGATLLLGLGLHLRSRLITRGAAGGMNARPVPRSDQGTFRPGPFGTSMGPFGSVPGEAPAATLMAVPNRWLKGVLR